MHACFCNIAGSGNGVAVFGACAVQMSLRPEPAPRPGGCLSGAADAVLIRLAIGRAGLAGETRP
jgi:hypothetical protein